MKKSELNGLTVKDLRVFAKNNAIQLANNLTKPKTIEAILASDYQFVADEPKHDRVFKIGSRVIPTFGANQSIANIKSLVAWELKNRQKINPAVKLSDITVTTPNGKVFKASELSNASNFIKLQVFPYIYKGSTDLPTELVAVREKIDTIIKHASKFGIDWEKVGSDKTEDIMELYDLTAKDLITQGLLTEENVPQIEMY